jgi:hypothetical protein
MAKAAKKQHEKTKYTCGVYGPDGTFYSIGVKADVQLVVLYNEKGRKMGTYWSHNKEDLCWKKVPGDEIRRIA